MLQWIYGTLQGSIYTVCSLLSNKSTITIEIWTLPDNIYSYIYSSAYRSFPRFPQPAIFLSSTVGFISVKMRLTDKIVEKWSTFIEENFRCGRIKKKAGNENHYRI